MRCAVLVLVLLLLMPSASPGKRRKTVGKTGATTSALPYRPPAPALGTGPVIRAGHGPIVAQMGVDPEASYYDEGANAIYAGNRWDNARQAWVATNRMRPFIREHEFAHAFDSLYLTDADRERLRRAMRLKTKKPWGGTAKDQNQQAPTPAERFADWYASLARGVNMPGSGASRTGTYDDTRFGGRRAWAEFIAVLDEVRKRNGLPNIGGSPK